MSHRLPERRSYAQDDAGVNILETRNQKKRGILGASNVDPVNVMSRWCKPTLLLTVAGRDRRVIFRYHC